MGGDDILTQSSCDGLWGDVVRKLARAPTTEGQRAEPHSAEERGGYSLPRRKGQSQAGLL